MTQGHPPKSEMEASHPSELPPPPFTSVDSASLETLENVTKPCHVHGASQTPYIDAHLRQPRTKALLHTLSAALADAADEECCTKCATESATHTLSLYLSELRAAKKNGQWSAEEKKGLKTEAKGLFKGVKRDFKKAWKANKRQA